jgi:D-xylose transport system ATP-binding protein
MQLDRVSPAARAGDTLCMTEIEGRVGSPTTAVLEAVGLHLAYGGVKAVEGVSLSIHAGEIHALLGDNGAGKSTTLKLLAGALQPDAGKIYCDGEPVSVKSPRVARGLGVETVYQDLALADTLDVTQNIFAGRELHYPGGVIRRREMDAFARKLLSDLDVRVPSNLVSMRSLSGGQRQGTAIARAAGWGSRVLLLDEPTAALGVAERTNVLNLLRTLRERGIGMLLISHNLADVFAIADRITVLRRAKVVGAARVEETDQRTIVALITGADSAEFRLHPGKDTPQA